MSMKKKQAPKTEAQNAEETELAALRRRNEELNAHIKQQESHVDAWKRYASDLDERNGVLIGSLSRIALCPTSDVALGQIRQEAVSAMHKVSEMPLRKIESRYDLGHIDLSGIFKRVSDNC